MGYRGFTNEELEREYSPSSMIGGDITPVIERYGDESAAARKRPGTLENLTYGSKPSRVLDFFPAAEANAPLHVFIHGGYWQQLSQKESASMAPSILAAGSAFATLNYTLAPDAHIADMVEECRQALAWLAGEASNLGFDHERVTLSGHSAGAHLAAMVVMEPGEELQASNLQIKQAILISGVYDLTPIPLTTVNEPLQLTTSDVAALSPLLLKPKLHPRTKVVVAENDTQEFIRQSRDYAAHLESNGVQASFELARGMHHFDIILEPQTFRLTE